MALLLVIHVVHTVTDVRIEHERTKIFYGRHQRRRWRDDDHPGAMRHGNQKAFASVEQNGADKTAKVQLTSR